MNNIHQQLWTAFNDIYFEETRHKYTDSLGTKYQSATGWIKNFVAEVDWDEKAKGSAIKRLKALHKDIPQYESTDEEIQLMTATVRAEWDASGAYARDLGTQIHLVMENLWYKKDYRFDDRLSEKYPDMKEDFEWRKKNVCMPLFKKMKDIYAPVANEFVVYDSKCGLCGTIDFLAYNMITDSYAIIDWKTSKDFKTTGFKGETLLAPFEDIQACNTSEYAIQLSLYKYLLTKKLDIKIDELILFQLPGKDNPMPQVHKCFDFTDRIKKLLEG